jgi:hypothetical protein
MCFYGYIAPVAERVAGFPPSDIWWVLAIVGAGLVLGNALGGRSADTNLHQALRWWLAAMIESLVLVGLVAPCKWMFLLAAFALGIRSFANVSLDADARHQARGRSARARRDRQHRCLQFCQAVGLVMACPRVVNDGETCRRFLPPAVRATPPSSGRRCEVPRPDRRRKARQRELRRSRQSSSRLGDHAASCWPA